MKIQNIFVVFFILINLSYQAGFSSPTPVPSNMDQLLSSSDMIVIGHIDEIISMSQFSGYNNKAPSLPYPFSLPLVDFRIEVEDIIRDDEEFPYNGLLIYRTFINHKKLNSSRSASIKKGRRIFFLARNPDNLTYGIQSVMHMIHLDNKKGVFFSYNEIPFYLSNDERMREPDKFVNLVKEKVKSKSQKYKVTPRSLN